MNEVKKLKLEVNKHKAYVKLYKNKVDLLWARLDDKVHQYAKLMSTINNHITKETHWANTYLMRG